MDLARYRCPTPEFGIGQSRRVPDGDALQGLDVRSAVGDDEASQQLLAALSPFLTELASRRQSEWFVTARPAEFSYGADQEGDHRWLGTDLTWSPEQPDSVEIHIEFRSWVPPRLRAESVRLWRLRMSVEVPCECARDHGNHPVDERRFEGSSPGGLRTTHSAALAQLDDWLLRGTAASSWRIAAGLPE